MLSYLATGRKEKVMGWTSYHIDKINGKIDRKSECDAICTGETEAFKWEVIKSAMKGSTHYAAVRKTDKQTGEAFTFASIILTRINNDEYCNFYYKDMSESMGPNESKCPASILDLLDPTDNAFALKWRERCREYNAGKNNLGRLPIGTVIQFMFNGSPTKAFKHAPAYQFKTPFWMLPDGHYIPKKYIPNAFTII